MNHVRPTFEKQFFSLNHISDAKLFFPNPSEIFSYKQKQTEPTLLLARAARSS